MQASLARLRSSGARPPYCFGSLSRAAPGRGPCVVLVRWCGFLRLSRLRREQAVGGAGARGVQVQLRPPLGVAVPSGGGETSPRPRGGWRAGAPTARRPGGGSWGERGGGAAPLFPTPLPWGGGPWPPSLSFFFPGAPPLGIHVQPGLPGSRGRRARPGRCRWVSVAGGGGEVSLPRSAPPSSPGGHQGGPLRLRIPGCRHSRAACGAGAEPPVSSGQCGIEWAPDWGRLARGCARRGCGVPPLGAAALWGGCGAAVSPADLRPPTGRGGGGERGGEGWEGGGVPRSPPLVPWRRPPTAAGGGPGGSGPGDGEPAADWGGALFPRPPPPFGCQTLVQALARAPCSPRCCRPEPAGQGGGERASEC